MPTLRSLIQNRNLHFRNAITEGSVVAEFNYSCYQIGNTKDRFTGYLFAGLSLYSHMPEAEIDGIWYEPQPLGTEGQGTTAGASVMRPQGSPSHSASGSSGTWATSLR